LLVKGAGCFFDGEARVKKQEQRIKKIDPLI